MARFLFVSYAATGHLNPTLSVVRTLVERGHEVAVLTAPVARDEVAASGASCFPTVRWRATVDDVGLQTDSGSVIDAVRRLRWLLREKFFAQAENQIYDLEQTLSTWPADIVVTSETIPGVSIFMERTRRPWATLAVEATCTLPSADLFPWGSAMPVPSSRAQRWAAAAMRWVYARLSRSLEAEWSVIRARHGLPKCGHLAASFGSPYLYMVPSPAEFDAPRSDLPPQVHHVGPCLPRAPVASDSWEPPFERELPLVYATAGTVFNDVGFLTRLIDAARGEAFNLFVTLGKNRSATEFPNLPANVRVAPFVNQDLILPKTSAIICNGGSGAVMGALVHGVPLVVLPMSADQPENAQRCAELGAGIALRRRPLKAEAIRGAVRQLLAESKYRQRARALSSRFSALNGPANAAGLLEGLAREHGAGRDIQAAP